MKCCECGSRSDSEEAETCFKLTVTDDDATLALLDSMAVEAAAFKPLEPGVVGGQAMILWIGAMEPERHHAPQHRLDYENILGLAYLVKKCLTLAISFFLNLKLNLQQ
jgi:hypothetical protein